MDHLIYTAVSGATRSLTQQQIHANNLANANTDGFRADLEKASSTPVQGMGYDSRYMVQSQNGGISVKAGGVVETGYDLDVAIKGNGFFAVVGPDGREVYTRNGAFDVGPDGDVTVNGRPVVGDNGPIVLPPFSSVFVGDDGTISIVPLDEDGAITVDVDRFKLVDIPANRLSKSREGWLVRSGGPAGRSDAVEVVGGHLEGSNVSAVQEMVSTMSLNRQFEAQIKMMKAAEGLVQAGNRLLRGS